MSLTILPFHLLGLNALIGDIDNFFEWRLKIGPWTDKLYAVLPAGSTAYNLSVHGPILSLHSKKLSISPISAFRPRRWKGKIVSDKIKIVIKNLNPIKRPISAVADNLEVRNAKSITVKTNKKIKFS